MYYYELCFVIEQFFSQSYSEKCMSVGNDNTCAKESNCERVKE